MEAKTYMTTRDIEGVRLSKADVTKLAELLAVEGGGPIRAETDAFVFKDLEEFLASEHPATWVDLTRSDNHVAVRIQPWAADVSLSDPGSEARGISETLVDFLKTRRVIVTPMRLTIACGFIGAVVLFLGFPSVTRRLDAAGPWGTHGASLSILGLGYVGGWSIGRTNAWFRRQPIKYRGDKMPINVRAAAWDVAKILLGVAAGAFVAWLGLRR